jgi:hypothetical protein
MVVTVAAASLVAAGVLAGIFYVRGKETHVRTLRAKHEALLREQEGIHELDRRVSAVELWLQGRGARSLEHWSRFSRLTPTSSDFYLEKLRADADGAIVLDIRARTGEVLDRVIAELVMTGYTVRPGRLAAMITSQDYPYSMSITIVPPNDTPSGDDRAPEKNHSHGEVNHEAA